LKTELVVVEAVPVGILPGEDDRPARAADRIGHERPVEPHALPRDPVDVRGLDEFPVVAVGADRLVGMVVGIDEDDVRTGAVDGEGRGAQHQQGKETGHGSFIPETKGA
jgi:hypothetical protein